MSWIFGWPRAHRRPLAILAALLQRRIDGQGRRIDISMLEAMGEWMGYPMYYAFEGAPPPPRAGAAHATIFPYGPFPTGGGGTVMLGLQNEREWQQFCAPVLQQPALATDERFKANALRVANRDALRALILQAFRDLSAEQVIERLEQAQIANANVNGMHDVWEHPQLKARERWTAVDTSAGPVPALLPPAEKRGLVLMDPPYETERKDFPQLVELLQKLHQRWSSGVYALWYPIKDRALIDRFEKKMQKTGIRRQLVCELCPWPDDVPTGLNGCGLLVINPPFQFAAEADRIPLPQAVAAWWCRPAPGTAPAPSCC